MIFGFATEASDPSIRNSNLLPVNANGEVRFLSVLSFTKCGRTLAPMFIWTARLPAKYSSFSIAFNTSVSSSPRKTDTTAGGASLAPRRWSFPALATEIRSTSAYSSTALITAVRKIRNCVFSPGVLPGSRIFMPSSVTIDQLLCFPLPLMPSNGFSWRRQTRPCLSATFFMISIVSWLWSTATFVVSNTGANSCCAGATSLCLVLAGMPSFQSSTSRSCM